MLKALVSLTFLRCREDVAVGLSGGGGELAFALIFWLKLSGFVRGFGNTGGGRLGVNLIGTPVGVLVLEDNCPGGANFNDGFGATGGGIFVGGGIARASSLNGSG